MLLAGAGLGKGGGYSYPLATTNQVMALPKKQDG